MHENNEILTDIQDGGSILHLLVYLEKTRCLLRLKKCAYADLQHRFCNGTRKGLTSRATKLNRRRQQPQGTARHASQVCLTPLAFQLSVDHFALVEWENKNLSLFLEDKKLITVTYH